MDSFAKEVYTDASYAGKLSGYFTSVVFIVLSCVGIYYGWKLWHQESKYTETVDALITEVICQQVNKTIADADTGTSKSTISYTCLLDLLYTIDGVDYENSITIENLLGDSIYKQGDQITILYELGDPTSIVYNETDNTLAGKLLFAFSIFTIIASLFSVYMLYNSKFAAASSGAGMFARAISGN